MGSSDFPRERFNRTMSVLAGQLPPDDRAAIEEFASVGEWGLAFETLCTQLFEYSVPIPRASVAELEEYGTRMGLEPSLWRELSVLKD